MLRINLIPPAHPTEILHAPSWLIELVNTPSWHLYTQAWSFYGPLSLPCSHRSSTIDLHLVTTPLFCIHSYSCRLVHNHYTFVLFHYHKIHTTVLYHKFHTAAFQWWNDIVDCCSPISKPLLISSLMNPKHRTRCYDQALTISEPPYRWFSSVSHMSATTDRRLPISDFLAPFT